MPLLIQTACACREMGGCQFSPASSNPSWKAAAPQDTLSMDVCVWLLEGMKPAIAFWLPIGMKGTV